MNFYTGTDISSQIILYFHQAATSFWDAMFTGITILGEQEVFIVVICFIFWNISREKGCLLGITVLFSAVVNLILKLLFVVPRPYLVLDDISGKRLETATGYAFPSGHTQNSAAFYVGLTNTVRRKWFTLTAFLLPLLIGLSRIYLGVHWPFDTAAGYILGVFTALLVLRFTSNIINNKRMWKRLAISIGISAGAAAVFLAFMYSNSDNPSENILDLVKSFALFSGLFFGTLISNGKSAFSEQGSWKKKTLRYVIGVATSFLILSGLKLITDSSIIIDIMRYFLTSYWAFGLYPLIGLKTGLFSLQGTGNID